MVPALAGRRLQCLQNQPRVGTTIGLGKRIGAEAVGNRPVANSAPVDGMPARVVSEIWERSSNDRYQDMLKNVQPPLARRILLLIAARSA